MGPTTAAATGVWLNQTCPRALHVAAIQRWFGGEQEAGTNASLRLSSALLTFACLLAAR